MRPTLWTLCPSVQQSTRQSIAVSTLFRIKRRYHRASASVLLLLLLLLSAVAFSGKVWAQSIPPRPSSACQRAVRGPSMLTLWGRYRTQSTKGRGVWTRRQVETLWDSHPCSEATVSAPALSQEDPQTGRTITETLTKRTLPTCPSTSRVGAGFAAALAAPGSPSAQTAPRGLLWACSGDVDLHLLLKSSVETFLPVFPIMNSLKHRGNWKKKKKKTVSLNLTICIIFSPDLLTQAWQAPARTTLVCG